MSFAVSIGLAFVLFAQSANGGGRPLECGGQDAERAANKWERAKEPRLQDYCSLLASGTSKLANGGALARDVPAIASAADKLLPGHSAPLVLKGRALLKLGQLDEALHTLGEARSRDERAFDDPVALLAWAQVNARTGHRVEAGAAYRAALPRTSNLAVEMRSSASFEAGLVIMGLGPKSIGDAIAIFRQARRDAQDVMQLAVCVALSLALDRAGMRDEAKALLAERNISDAKSILSDPRVVGALVNAGAQVETDALQAIARDARDPQAARASWRLYAEAVGETGVWGSHARALADGLTKVPASPGAPSVDAGRAAPRKDGGR